MDNRPRAFTGVVKRTHDDGISRVVRVALEEGGEWSVRVATGVNAALVALPGERLRFILDPHSNVVVAIEPAA